MYNCVGSTVLGSSVGVLLGVSPLGGTGWEERTTVGLSPEGSPLGVPVDSLVNSNDMRGSV